MHEPSVFPVAAPLPLRAAPGQKPPVKVRDVRELGTDLPTVCVRHGAPGSWSRTLYIPSHPRIRFDDLSLMGKALDQLRPRATWERFEERMKKTVWARSQWAGCGRCRRYILLRRLLSLALFTIAALTLVGPIAPYTEWIGQPYRSLLLIAGVALTLPAIKSISVVSAFTKSEVTEDGSRLIVTDPHPEFALAAQLLNDPNPDTYPHNR